MSDPQPLLEPTQPKKQIDKPLICFCVLNFFLNAGVSVITPFYPPLAKDKAGVSQSMIGYIFSLNPIGAFLFSFILGNKMQLWGRKRCMVIGLFLQSTAIICFGFLDFLTEKYTVFVIVSFATRFLQGASRAAYSSISFAFIPLLWPDSIQQKISLLESLTGLGLMCGPFIGALLDYILGYQEIFYIMGGLFAFSIIPTITFLPDDNKVIEKEAIKFDVKKIMTHKWILSLSLLLTMMSAGTTYLNPLYSIHMGQFGLKEYQASLVFGTLSVVYIGSINFIPKLCRVLDKKLVLFIGLLIGVLGVFLIGPAFFLPDEWWISFIALPFIGLSNSFCVLPSIPQYMEYMNLIIQDPSVKTSISDLSSGLFISFYSLGNFVGPVFGGVIFDAFLGDTDTVKQQLYAFQGTSYVLAGAMLLSAIVYFIFGQAYMTNRLKVEESQKTEDLSASLQPVEEANIAINDSDNSNL